MKLTKRQAQVLEWVQRGASNKQIAKRLGLTESTIKLHVSKLLKLYNAQTRHQLALFSASGKVAELPDMTDLEPDPIGWVLRSGESVKGFVTGKRPSDEWEPVYTKLKEKNG